VSSPEARGWSYGDAAQCTGGLTIDTAALSNIGALDEVAGTIQFGGGVGLHDLMRRLIPEFVAKPGTGARIHPSKFSGSRSETPVLEWFWRFVAREGVANSAQPDATALV